MTPELPEVVGGCDVPGFQVGVPLLQQVQDAFEWIREVAGFDPAEAQSVTALEILFANRRGTAADLSHLLIALVRHWRIPARFVSGYLDAAYFDPDDAQPPEAPARPQTLHHWAEVLIPGAGWRGFDPALGLVADATYIRVAIGRDANDIAPIRQSCRGECEQPELNQALTVSRISV
nr:transglutaminase family protein [Thiocystis violacea]